MFKFPFSKSKNTYSPVNSGDKSRYENCHHCSKTYKVGTGGTCKGCGQRVCGETNCKVVGKCPL